MDRSRSRSNQKHKKDKKNKKSKRHYSSRSSSKSNQSRSREPRRTNIAQCQKIKNLRLPTDSVQYAQKNLFRNQKIQNNHISYGLDYLNKKRLPNVGQYRTLIPFNYPLHKTPNFSQNPSHFVHTLKPSVYTPIYKDDEELIKQGMNGESDPKIEIQVLSQRSLVKLKKAQVIPAMVTIKTQGGKRSNADIVCVIDTSGSMLGTKIALVKSTLKFLLDVLNPCDRFSLIQFNNNSKRLCGLKCVKDQNKKQFIKAIQNLRAQGGTNISSGLSVGLTTLKDRRYINEVSTIIFLSDGQDTTGMNIIDKFKTQFHNVCSVQSFGYGSSIDKKFMTNLAEIGNGNFFFIEDQKTLDESFCNIIGGIISVAVKQLTINITNIAKKRPKPQIKKTYGKMWKKINQEQYQIKLIELLSGVKKNFVFQLEIPFINQNVTDINRDQYIVEASFTANCLNNYKLKGRNVLKITFLNEDQIIPDMIQNMDVNQNFLRMKAVQAIQINSAIAQSGQFTNAQSGINEMINAIKSHQYIRQQNMADLVDNLNLISRNWQSKNHYQKRGRFLCTERANRFQCQRHIGRYLNMTQQIINNCRNNQRQKKQKK